MTKKISEWQKMALLAVGISASLVSVASAAAPVLYERHSSGSVWGYTGIPCNGKVCAGWEMLNNDPATVQIAAGNGTLYQLDADGSVWQWNGTVCSGNTCKGWVQVGASATQIWVSGISLYKFNGGEFWDNNYQDGGGGVLSWFTGLPCDSPSSCKGWAAIDCDQESIGYDGWGGSQYYAQGSSLFKIVYAENDGGGLPSSIYQYTGPECTGDWSCPGWLEILNYSNAWSMASGLAGVYEMNLNGDLFAYVGSPCSNGSCTWAQIGDTSLTASITAGDSLYQLQQNGLLLQYTGTPCNSTGCNGWLELDSNPAISYIIAGQNTVYEQHTDGSIWQFTGTRCHGCSGWTELDNNPLTVQVVPGY